MKASKLLSLPLLLLCISNAYSGEEVKRLLAEYGKIETVTCKVRRTKEGGAGKIRFLSRIYWTSRNKIHSEKLAPVKQRTIVDGKALYQYTEGSGNKGFSRSIEALSDQMKIALKHVPGTAMDHLLLLKDLPETALPAEGDAARRVGIAADRKYVVLRFDAENRLAGIVFFKSAEMKERIADYDYMNFSEVIPGVWIPFTHRISVTNGEIGLSETVKIDSYTANKPIAESLFVPASFFDKSIDFVDDFAKIFPE